MKPTHKRKCPFCDYSFVPVDTKEHVVSAKMLDMGQCWNDLFYFIWKFYLKIETFTKTLSNWEEISLSVILQVDIFVVVIFFLVGLFSLISEDIIVTDKLQTRTVPNFKARFMFCLQQHFSMFPWAKIY